ncbi:hypothetical protein [Microbulbifer discodermiae]|uniref:hypothetical protein n=1 Tax=Microbulbifer sp. 2201CG32-9 TaxID=3232309 RepID=UPI00345C0247
MVKHKSQPVFSEHDDRVLWATQQQLLHYYDSGDGLFLKNSDTGKTVCFLHEDGHRLGPRPEQMAVTESLDEAIHQLDFLSLVLSPGNYLELNPDAQLGLSSILSGLRERLFSASTEFPQ